MLAKWVGSEDTQWSSTPVMSPDHGLSTTMQSWLTDNLSIAFTTGKLPRGFLPTDLPSKSLCMAACGQRVRTTLLLLQVPCPTCDQRIHNSMQARGIPTLLMASLLPHLPPEGTYPMTTNQFRSGERVNFSQVQCAELLLQKCLNPF